MPKKRKWLTLEHKLDIIKLHEEGASHAKITHEKHIDESSVRKIIKKKDQYKSHGMATASYLSKSITKNRSSLMVNMERLLSIWVEDLNKKRIPLSEMEIQAKARSLYIDLKKENGTAENEEGGGLVKILMQVMAGFIVLKNELAFIMCVLLVKVRVQIKRLL